MRRLSKETNPLPREEHRRRRREYVIIVTAFIALVALYYLERNLYQFSVDAQLPNNLMVFTLINVNLLLLLLLLFFVIRNIIKLVIERRSKIRWSKLRTRLVLAFSLFSLIPTALLFFLSTSMITSNVEGWFTDQVNNAMHRSVEVVETYTHESREQALHFARMVSERLAVEGLLEDADDRTIDRRLGDLRRTYGVWGLELYRPDLTLWSASIVETASFEIERLDFPFADPYDALDPLEEPALVDTFGGQDMARGLSVVISSEDRSVLAYVVANVAIQGNLLRKMGQVSQAYDEYTRMGNLQEPLQTGYVFTLIMVFVMVMLLATWVGLHLSKAISVPIQELAEATREISKGNLGVRVPPAGDDEIGTVVDSFNTMTSELGAKEERLRLANLALQERNVEMEASKSYIEAVIASVAAGIVSFDREGRITTINAIAAEVLGIRAEEARGRMFVDVMAGEPLVMLQELFRTLEKGVRTLQRQWVLTQGEEVRTVLVNLTGMQDEEGALLGAVLVFEDLTELVTAQRAAAWREVARRIAHEIKNPLTPIQLSAQRLRKRYLAQFSEQDAVFDECTQIIIEQVEGMKALVNEFSQFARMPHATPAPNDLNALVAEMLPLYRQAHRGIEFLVEHDATLPLVDLDREQVKRVIINLLDNAVAAMDERGTIVVRTRYKDTLGMAVFELADTGPGIPIEDRQRIFEPYYTTKKGGTGLGLSIVKKIIEDHHGYLRVYSNVPSGAVFAIEFPVAETRVGAVT